MGKFFIPLGKGQVRDHPLPKKKIVPNCNLSLMATLSSLLRKLLTRLIQKTIRSIKDHKESGKTDNIDQLPASKRLLELKAIGKAELKQLAFHIIKEELNVEEVSLKPLLNSELKQEEIVLSPSVLQFYEVAKKQKLYIEAVEDAQRVRNKVNDKKKTKKEKVKVKKQAKLLKRKAEGKKTTEQIENNDDSKDQENIDQQSVQRQSGKPVESAQYSSQIQQESSKKVPTQSKSIKKDHVVVVQNAKKQGKTEFKKTGRNKYLQEKRDAKFKRKSDRRPEPVVPQRETKPVNAKVGRWETPHPSWQAKRAIKNQMFIQPFEGKKIML